MVGRDEGCGNQRQDLQSLFGISESPALSKAGAGFLKCCRWPLAQGTRPAKSRSCDCLAAETFTATELHDPKRGGGLLAVCSIDAPFGEVLPDRLVYWQPEGRDCWDEVVDDKS